MDVSDILFILTSLVPVLVRRDVTRKLLVVASRCVINIPSPSLSLSLSCSPFCLVTTIRYIPTLVNRLARGFNNQHITTHNNKHSFTIGQSSEFHQKNT